MTSRYTRMSTRAKLEGRCTLIGWFTWHQSRDGRGSSVIGTYVCGFILVNIYTQGATSGGYRNYIYKRRDLRDITLKVIKVI